LWKALHISRPNLPLFPHGPSETCRSLAENDEARRWPDDSWEKAWGKLAKGGGDSWGRPGEATQVAQTSCDEKCANCSRRKTVKNLHEDSESLRENWEIHARPCQTPQKSIDSSCNNSPSRWIKNGAGRGRGGGLNPIHHIYIHIYPSGLRVDWRGERFRV